MKLPSVVMGSVGTSVAQYGVLPPAETDYLHGNYPKCSQNRTAAMSA